MKYSTRGKVQREVEVTSRSEFEHRNFVYESCVFLFSAYIPRLLVVNQQSQKYARTREREPMSVCMCVRSRGFFNETLLFRLEDVDKRRE